MPQVGFEPTIPVFERGKTLNASDRAANLVGGSDVTQDRHLFITVHIM
jgi:hypothetical protein